MVLRLDRNTSYVHGTNTKQIIYLESDYWSLSFLVESFFISFVNNIVKLKNHKRKDGDYIKRQYMYRIISSIILVACTFATLYVCNTEQEEYETKEVIYTEMKPISEKIYEELSSNAEIEETTTEELTSYQTTQESTYDERYLLMCVVETEVHGGDFNSKCNVASVVINRANDGRFGDSIYSVVTAPNQFAYQRTSFDQSTIDAVDYVLANGDTTDGCLWFHSGQWTETFMGAYVFTDEVGHHFYK